MTAPDPIRARLDELAALHAKATPGPWLYDAEYDSFSVWAGDPDRPHIIADTRLINGVGAENAALIVAAVNALPDLLSAVSAVADAAVAQEASAARWVEAIDEADNDTDRGYATGRAHAAEQAALRVRRALAAALTTRDGEAGR